MSNDKIKDEHFSIIPRGVGCSRFEYGLFADGWPEALEHKPVHNTIGMMAGSHKPLINAPEVAEGHLTESQLAQIKEAMQQQSLVDKKIEHKPARKLEQVCKCGSHKIPQHAGGVHWYWQSHTREKCSLELPNERCDCGLLRSEHIAGHADVQQALEHKPKVSQPVAESYLINAGGSGETMLVNWLVKPIEGLIYASPPDYEQLKARLESVLTGRSKVIENLRSENEALKAENESSKLRVAELEFENSSISEHQQIGKEIAAENESLKLRVAELESYDDVHKVDLAIKLGQTIFNNTIKQLTYENVRLQGELTNLEYSRDYGGEYADL